MPINNKTTDSSTANSEIVDNNQEIKFERGKHPNSLINLKPYPKGVSGNTFGRPTKYEHLRRSLNSLGQIETFNHQNDSQGTLREQVLQRIWNEAIYGDIKFIQFLALLGCLDEPSS